MGKLRHKLVSVVGVRAHTWADGHYLINIFLSIARCPGCVFNPGGMAIVGALKGPCCEYCVT